MDAPQRFELPPQRLQRLVTDLESFKTLYDHIPSLDIVLDRYAVWN